MPWPSPLFSSLPKSFLDYLAHHPPVTIHLYINFTAFHKFFKPVLTLTAVKGNKSSIAQIAT